MGKIAAPSKPIEKMNIQFGKHKGKSVDDVPADYLLWLWNQGLKEELGKTGHRSELAAYIMENLENLQMDAPDVIVSQPKDGGLSQEQIEATNQMATLSRVVGAYRKNGKGKHFTITCPLCHGELSFGFAASNGHARVSCAGSCKTSWME